MSNGVSNTSPLIVLAKAGLLDLLPKLFSEVTVPQAVRDEIKAGADGDAMKQALPSRGWPVCIGLGGGGGTTRLARQGLRLRVVVQTRFQGTQIFAAHSSCEI